eukprot:TRINITY_DN8511_c0_g2_i1.p1 TRINITY_DN8511_c0_g2~~TRINITY_DN8511_c0_g2_i1.p1  ORF type:complete len:630 (-),score=78.14 TRINITY_DN8511_c0_g2_i1:164-2053(-)
MCIRDSCSSGHAEDLFPKVTRRSTMTDVCGVALNVNDVPRANSVDSSPSNEERPSSAPDRMDNTHEQDDKLPPPQEDIRLDPQYAKFYNAYQGEERLPPPLEGTIMSELWDKHHRSEDLVAPLSMNASQPGMQPGMMPRMPMQVVQDLEPPSPDSLTSMSFSIGQRLAMNCLDSPHLSPMSAAINPQLVPTPNPLPSRQRTGAPLGGIPNAETWMSGGWDPAPQQHSFGQQAVAPAANSGIGGDVVIGGMPYHVVPHQQWVQMMNGQQQMVQPVQEPSQPIHGPRQGGRGTQRKGGRGTRRGRGSRSGWNNSNSQDMVQAGVDGGASPYNDISEVVGKMYALSKDQLGCRFLQKCLDDGSEVADMIFQEIEPHFIELMTDPFGNYLCQKLMEICQPAIRSKMVDSLAPSLADICFDSHGTRAVQRLIAILAQNNTQQSEQQVVVSALKQNLISLVRNLNGNHVVQACLHNLSSDTNKFIFDNVTANCVHVATHRHGCCVMQRCIDYGNAEQREALISEIVNKTLLLVQDPFGNYVIQYILDLKSPEILADVFGLLTGNFVKLSMGKFSSNVVEKCLALLSPEAITCLLTELSHPDCIAMLLKDSYANYVIQKAVMLEHSAVYNLSLIHI